MLLLIDSNQNIVYYTIINTLINIHECLEVT